MAAKHKFFFYPLLILIALSLTTVIGKSSPGSTKSLDPLELLDPDSMPSLDFVEFRNYQQKDSDAPPQQLGPFFGFFHNLFTQQQESSSCPVCTNCTTCPECDVCPGTMPAENQNITDCNSNEVVVLTSAPSGTINVNTASGSVNQCYYGFVANPPYNYVAIKCTILSKGFLRIITPSTPSQSNGGILLDTDYASTKNYLFMSYMTNNNINDNAAIQFKCSWKCVK